MAGSVTWVSDRPDQSPNTARDAYVPHVTCRCSSEGRSMGRVSIWGGGITWIEQTRSRPDAINSNKKSNYGSYRFTCNRAMAFLSISIINLGLLIENWKSLLMISEKTIELDTHNFLQFHFGFQDVTCVNQLYLTNNCLHRSYFIMPKTRNLNIGFALI